VLAMMWETCGRRMGLQKLRQNQEVRFNPSWPTKLLILIPFVVILTCEPGTTCPYNFSLVKTRITPHSAIVPPHSAIVLCLSHPQVTVTIYPGGGGVGGGGERPWPAHALPRPPPPDRPVTVCLRVLRARMCPDGPRIFFCARDFLFVS
jgi:hypothetical protein